MNKNLPLIIVFLCLSFLSVKAQTVLFSEDFHNGIPIGWTNTGTANGAPNNWVKWRTNTHANGAFDTTYGNVLSPTAANGFAIFDSDSLDNGGHTTTGGQPDQSRGPANVMHHCELTTTAINVAGHPYLRLQFYQMLANFRTISYVGISSDGTTWVYDTLNASLSVNSATAVRDQKVELDISNIVHSSNNVYLRFVFDGEYYDWQIDDITIMDLPDNDLAVKTSQGIFGSSAFNLFYSSIPVKQLGVGTTDSLTFMTTYSNFGKAVQPNCRGVFTEIRGQASLGVNVSAPPTSLPYSRDSTAWTKFGTAGIGSYQVAVNVASDSIDYDPSNNVDTVGFAISDSVYSINSSRKNNAVAYFLVRSNVGTTFRLGNLFEVMHTDTLSSITTAMEGGTSGTHAGAVIRASVYAVSDTVIAGNRTLYYNTPNVTTYTKTLLPSEITSNTATNVTPITMAIDPTSGNSVLTPGLYWVAIEGVSPAPGDSIILAATTPYQTGGFPIVEQNNTLFFLGNTEAPYCNMNFGHVSSLLYASFVWSPSSPYAGSPVVFNANHTNAGPSATYRWDINGLNTGLSDTRYGKIMRDTFSMADSFYVCLTVTDGSDSVLHCQWANIRPTATPTCTATFAVVSAGTPHTYIAYSYATGSNLAYHWYFGDGDSSSLQYPTHTYAAAGYYTLCLRVDDTVTHCTATYCDTNRYYSKTNSAISLTVVHGSLGINNMASYSPISIYPNPTNDAFNIKVNTEMIGGTFTLTDLTGREVAAGQLKREITTVPIGGLSSGIYVIHLGAENFKLIKE